MKGTTKAMAQKKYETHEDYLDAKRKRAVIYNQANTKRYALSLNIATDADIIGLLDTFKNKQAYIKSLIRADMKAKGIETKEED